MECTSTHRVECASSEQAVHKQCTSNESAQVHKEWSAQAWSAQVHTEWSAQAAHKQCTSSALSVGVVCCVLQLRALSVARTFRCVCFPLCIFPLGWLSFVLTSFC